MDKRNLIFLTAISLSFVLLLFSFVAYERKTEKVSEELNEQGKLKIAACPTCFTLAKNIDPNKYEIIETGSTAESLDLLESKKVDMILAGRTLKPHEPRADEILIKDGYSFLSSQEKVIYLDQLKDEPIYTDLNPEAIKTAFSLQKIESVEDVYAHLDKGLVITSWENTDYSRAVIVHVLEKNGERVKLSRRPTVYCPNVCSEEARALAVLLNN